jgi:hypothetical protein
MIIHDWCNLRPVPKSAVIVYSSSTIELYLFLQQFWMTSPKIMPGVDGKSFQKNLWT